jgi:hypothetical protein
MSETDYETIKSDIKKLGNDMNKIGRRLPPYLLAVYGEIVALIELKRRLGNKYEIKYKGGQSKFDIELISKENQRNKISIDVKTSTYKNEFYGRGFGWALDKKKCKIHRKEDFCYFNYLVLIGIDDKNRMRFFIFSREETKNVPPNTSKRFKKSSNRIVMAFEVNRKNITGWDLNLMKNLDKYEDKWNKIK